VFSGRDNNLRIYSHYCMHIGGGNLNGFDEENLWLQVPKKDGTFAPKKFMHSDYTYLYGLSGLAPDPGMNRSRVMSRNMTTSRYHG